MRCIRWALLTGLLVLGTWSPSYAVGVCTDAAGCLEFPLVGGGGGGGGYATIQNEEISLAQRTILNFAGAGIDCVDNVGTPRTDCTVVGGWPLQNIAGGITWANSLANAVKVGKDTSNYWAIYHDPTLGLQINCVVADVENGCNYIRRMAAGKYFELQNSIGTPIFHVDADTGETTYARIDSRSTGNVLTLPFRWDFDLCGINPADSTLSHLWNKDPLSTAPTLNAKIETNWDTCGATFPDSDGDYGVGITRRLPVGYVVGSMVAEIWWYTSGTGNAVFQIAVKCYASNEAATTFNAEKTAAATAGTSGVVNVAAMGALTDTGCVGGELMRIRFYRNRQKTSPDDTLNASLHVEKVYISGYVAE